MRIEDRSPLQIAFDDTFIESALAMDRSATSVLIMRAERKQASMPEAQPVRKP